MLYNAVIAVPSKILTIEIFGTSILLSIIHIKMRWLKGRVHCFSMQVVINKCFF